MYIPGSEELVVNTVAAFHYGALVGFLWYNAYPGTGIHGRQRKPHYRRVSSPYSQFSSARNCYSRYYARYSSWGYRQYGTSGRILQDYKKTLYGEGEYSKASTPPPSFPETGWYRHGTPLRETDAGYSESKIVTQFWIVGCIMLAVITFCHSQNTIINDTAI